MSLPNRKQVVVVGGGAAGQMAAIGAAKVGARVILLEKMHQLGLKMGITGKGRCNLTNRCDMREFIANTPGNGKFLFSVYQQFTNDDLIDLLEMYGLKTKVERGGRVFPESDSAQEVRSVFRKILGDNQVRVHLNEVVQCIEMEAESVAKVTTDQAEYIADAVVIATGGISYPQTGSDGSGYLLARQLGHRIIDVRPALVPLVSQDSYCKELQGLTLKNSDVSIYVSGVCTRILRGEVLFTHFGISGPTILKLSDLVSEALAKSEMVEVEIDCKPALLEMELDARILRDLQKHRLKKMENALQELLPQRMISVVLRLAGIEKDIQAAALTKEKRRKLVDSIKRMRIRIQTTRPIQEAIVTAGGVHVGDVNPKTLESKRTKGIYFAGEVMDIHAYTGGYNLQAAFSTGYVAGINAGKDVI